MRPSLPPPSARPRSAATIALLLALGAQAHAQALLEPGPRSDLGEADVLAWRAGLQWRHDDNVFLSPHGESDQIQVATLGLNVNKAWSLQRLAFDVHVDEHRYDRHATLDFTALQYEGAFRWAFTPHLQGKLVAERREDIDPFSRFTGQALDRRTELQHGLDGEYQVGALGLLAGAFEQRSRHSALTEEPDATVRGGELGLRHEWPSGASLGWRYRQGQGSYDRSLSDFQDRHNELELRVATGPLSLGGRLGWLERQHDTQAWRDFSGWTGRLDAAWRLSGKTRLLAGLARELAAYPTAEASHYEGYRLFIGPEWKPTGKTTVSLRWAHGRRTYQGAPSPATGQREDRLDVLALGLSWEPVRALRILAGVQREQRNASLGGTDYRAKVYGLSATGYF